MEYIYNVSKYKFTLQTKNCILIEDNIRAYALIYLKKEINSKYEFENICNDYFNNYLVKKFQKKNYSLILDKKLKLQYLSIHQKQVCKTQISLPNKEVTGKTNY